MKKNVFVLLALFCLLKTSIAQTKTTAGPHERLLLDNGWRFFLGDIPFPIIRGQDMSYSNAKAGKSWGAADPGFDDTKWRILNLPHDWSVESAFDSTENPASPRHSLQSTRASARF